MRRNYHIVEGSNPTKLKIIIDVHEESLAFFSKKYNDNKINLSLTLSFKSLFHKFY